MRNLRPCLGQGHLTGTRWSDFLHKKLQESLLKEGVELTDLPERAKAKVVILVAKKLMGKSLGEHDVPRFLEKY